jgi:elongation factor G
MGELHLQIYVERMAREYSVETIIGPPRVRYREAVTSKAPFDYLHKKQSGGNGQYGRVVGYIEPIGEDSKEFIFENQMIGDAIPPQFHSSVEKGFKFSCDKGPLTGAPIEGIRIVLLDGASHPVDSNDKAFMAAAQGAFRQAYQSAKPIVLQPIMTVEVECPAEFQSEVVSGLNKRRGTIRSAQTLDGTCTIQADVPLVEMFGYSSALRSATEGKGTFSMEYLEHLPVAKDQQARISAEYLKSKADDEARLV